MVALKSLWQDQTALIIFFRRWGCVLCRVWARQLAQLYPLLKENNIRLIGVGVDEIGLEDFIQGDHFPGELYIDSNKTVYRGLQLKRFSWVSILTSLFTKESRDAIFKDIPMGMEEVISITEEDLFSYRTREGHEMKGRNEKMGGDLKGDGLQNGGAIVVKKGGEVLYTFKQERPAEHVANEKFAEILGLKYTEKNSLTEEQPTCESDACSR